MIHLHNLMYIYKYVYIYAYTYINIYINVDYIQICIWNSKKRLLLGPRTNSQEQPTARPNEDDDCFYYHSWRNNVVIAFGTLVIYDPLLKNSCEKW